MKISDRTARIYSVAYTVIMLAIGILSANKYVFVPSIPYFYVLIIPLFIVQARVFRQYNKDKFIVATFWVNILISVLLFQVMPFVYTQYLFLFHFLVLVVSTLKYPQSFILLIGTIIFNFATLMHLIVGKTLPIIWVSLISFFAAGMLVVSLLSPYPKIMLSDKTIRFGTPQNAETYYDEYFEVKDSVSVIIGRFVKVGKYVEG